MLLRHCHCRIAERGSAEQHFPFANQRRNVAANGSGTKTVVISIMIRLA